MRNLAKCACGFAVGGFLLCATSAWAGGQNGNAAWGDVAAKPSPSQQALSDSIAVDNYDLKHHNLTGADTTTVNETVGTQNVNETSTYNGAVTSTGSTNQNNVNQTTSQAYDGSQITVTSGQYSGTTTQGASAQSLTNGGTASSTNSKQ